MTDEEKKEKRKKWNREFQKKWRQKNKERSKEIYKRSREKHKEKRDEYDRQWRKNNKERLKERDAGYRKNNKEYREAIRQSSLEYFHNHREHYKEYIKLYEPYYRLTHKKGNNIMKTHWTEQLEKIDKQIAKLNQLRESIIEATSEPEEEQIEPTIDRYGFKKNERRVYYDLPEYQEVRDYRNMNHVPLEGASNYELYENGELFSRKEGRFVDGIIANNSGDVIWKVIGDDGTIIDIWRKMEMKRCFPEFKEKIKSRHGLQYS